jgi:hypothetical protein
MYELQADPNVPRAPVPSAVVKPPPFSPSRSAVCVNILWILSLVISLTCAMLATSLQQWARRYIQNTQPVGRSLQERARTRAFFVHGIINFHVPQTVEVLPALVHLALFKFFAGLIIYLFNIDRTMFTVVICWVALLSVGYGCITFMPVIWPDSPYYSPLSPLARFLYTRVLYLVLKVTHGVLSLFCSLDGRRRVREWLAHIGRRKHRGIEWEVKDAISKRSSEIDFSVLQWTVRVIREDDEQEKVFESIPGFFKSEEVKLDRDRSRSMTENAIGNFLRNTLSSNSVPESVKIRRLSTCLNAASEVQPAVCRKIFGDLVDLNWGEGLSSIELGLSLRSWDKASHGRFSPYIQGVVAVIVATVREHNEPWITLARSHLGISDSVFHDYLSHSDNVQLANLIDFTRRANRSDPFTLDVVKTLSKFDIRNTLPDLRRDFCALWNEIVRQAQNDATDSYPVRFLREIRHHYIALHHDTDAAPTAFSPSTDLSAVVLKRPSSYPLCNAPSHCSQSQSTDRGHCVVAVAEAKHPPATKSFTPSLPPCYPIHTTTHIPDYPSLGHRRVPPPHVTAPTPSDSVTPFHPLSTYVATSHPAISSTAPLTPNSTRAYTCACSSA